MEYLVCKKQRGGGCGGGCDYTIGCGMRYDILSAESVEDAIEKTVYPDGRDDYYCDLSDEYTGLKEILIIPIEHVIRADVGGMLSEFKERYNRRESEEKKAKELKELRRLQEKYGEE